MLVDLISCCVALFLKGMVNLRIAPFCPFVQMEETQYLSYKSNESMGQVSEFMCCYSVCIYHTG